MASAEVQLPDPFQRSNSRGRSADSDHHHHHDGDDKFAPFDGNGQILLNLPARKFTSCDAFADVIIYQTFSRLNQNKQPFFEPVAKRFLAGWSQSAASCCQRFGAAQIYEWIKRPTKNPAERWRKWRRRPTMKTPTTNRPLSRGS